MPEAAQGGVTEAAAQAAKVTPGRTSYNISLEEAQKILNLPSLSKPHEEIKLDIDKHYGHLMKVNDPEKVLRY